MIHGKINISVLQGLDSFMGVTTEKLGASEMNLNVSGFNHLLFALSRNIS